MLKLRLTRTGKKDQAYFRIVVAEHTAPIKGRFVEIVGRYNPRTKEIVIDKEKIKLWMNKGATPSNTVAKLLKREGLKHKLIKIHSFKKRPPKEKGEKKEDNAPETKADEQKTQKENAPKEEVKEDTQKPKDDNSQEKPVVDEKEAKEEKTENQVKPEEKK